jgi:hypothetical protein
MTVCVGDSGLWYQVHLGNGGQVSDFNHWRDDGAGLIVVSGPLDGHREDRHAAPDGAAMM